VWFVACLAMNTLVNESDVSNNASHSAVTEHLAAGDAERMVRSVQAVQSLGEAPLDAFHCKDAVLM
jgi:hypothetical protein